MTDARGFFYQGGGCQAALDTLFERVHRDQAVVLLVGASGCGRSVLVEQFCRQADPGVLALGVITGDILMSADQCFIALAASFADQRDRVAGHEDDAFRRQDIHAGNARSALLERLSMIRTSGRSPVAIVDDAHTLGVEACAGLLALCQEAAMPLVLTGDDSLPTLLNPASGFTTITLRAFTENETEEFVAAWLAVGDEDELPSHRAMARLHRQASGVPGKLAELLQSGAATRTGLLPAGFPVWHLAFTLLAVVLLLWLLLARSQPESRQGSVAATAEIPVPLPPPNEVTTDRGHGVVPATQVAAIAVPQPAVASESGLGKPAASMAPLPAQATTPEVVVMHEAVPVPKPVREPQNVGRKFSADEAALLKEKATRFTLQLFASFNEDAVQQFKARHAGLEVKTFRTIREDLPWYVAVTGAYRNKDAAKKAAAKLPADLVKLKPWPRSLQGIQDELRRRKE